MASPHHRTAWKFWLSGSSGAVLLAAIIYAFTYPTLYAGGEAKSEQPAATTANTAVKAQKLSGEDLYTINCSRCHSQRYPKEWTPGQWKTLMMHMRVRANIPADQAREILKYLQDESSN